MWETIFPVSTSLVVGIVQVPELLFTHPGEFSVVVTVN
jgi:hypothetical protein